MGGVSTLPRRLTALLIMLASAALLVALLPAAAAAARGGSDTPRYGQPCRHPGAKVVLSKGVLKCSSGHRWRWMPAPGARCLDRGKVNRAGTLVCVMDLKAPELSRWRWISRAGVGCHPAGSLAGTRDGQLLRCGTGPDDRTYHVVPAPSTD